VGAVNLSLSESRAEAWAARSMEAEAMSMKGTCLRSEVVKGQAPGNTGRGVTVIQGDF
jgi:hypothetical protein